MHPITKIVDKDIRNRAPTATPIIRTVLLLVVTTAAVVGRCRCVCVLTISLSEIVVVMKLVVMKLGLVTGTIMIITNNNKMSEIIFFLIVGPHNH